MELKSNQMLRDYEKPLSAIKTKKNVRRLIYFQVTYPFLLETTPL